MTANESDDKYRRALLKKYRLTEELKSRATLDAAQQAKLATLPSLISELEERDADCAAILALLYDVVRTMQEPGEEEEGGEREEAPRMLFEVEPSRECAMKYEVWG